MTRAATRVPPRQRLLALALACALLATGWVVLVEPLRALYPAREDAIDEAQARVARYRALAAARGEALRRLQAAGGDAGGRGVFFNGATPALAAAALQDHLGQVAGAAGAQVRSARVLEGAAAPAGGAIAVEADIDADIGALVAMLVALEGGERGVFVDDLVIRAPEMHNPGTGGGRLAVRLVARGYGREAP